MPGAEDFSTPVTEDVAPDYHEYVERVSDTPAAPSPAAAPGALLAAAVLLCSPCGRPSDSPALTAACPPWCLAADGPGHCAAPAALWILLESDGAAVGRAAGEQLRPLPCLKPYVLAGTASRDATAVLPQYPGHGLGRHLETKQQAS